MKRESELIKGCLQILEKMRIGYNSPIGPNTRKLITNISELMPLMRPKYPVFAEILSEAISKISNHGFINAYAFGDIRTCIKILNSFLLNDRKKIFISHSSKDKELIGNFVDYILCSGVGLTPSDIFCTSIEDMAIKNGEDIRKHIYDNIRNSDFSFLMISQAYKESEICLNEMGAVWSCNSKVKLYLLPNVDFNSLGWLYSVQQAEKVDNSIALDALHKDLIDYYQLSNNGITWSRQREKFLNYIKDCLLIAKILKSI